MKERDVEQLTKEFIMKAKSIHGDRYNYDLVKYVNSYMTVKIVCSKHGIFEQTPNTHLKGSGCPMCALNENASKKRSNRYEFIKKAIDVHGFKYDYTKMEYKNAHTKISIICPEHGVFMQSPISHLRGSGCPKCAVIKNKRTTNDFIEKASKIYNDKYSYNKTVYTTAHEKVIVTCPIHGDFEIIANSHLRGAGCPSCSKYGKMNTEQFIEKAKLVHGNRYDYSKTVYVSARKPVKIICPEHGEFTQIASYHSRGYGCPLCKGSSGERDIADLLTRNNIKYIPQKTFIGCKFKNLLRFDFYLPDYNLVIEYDGQQHFKPVEYFGGKKIFEENKIRDNIKDNYCHDNDIILCRIKYNESIYDKIKKFIHIN